MPFSQEQAAFLGSIGVDAEAIETLNNPSGQVIVTSDTLASWVRFAWRAARSHTRDVYRWYDPAELIAFARAADNAQCK